MSGEIPAWKRRALTMSEDIVRLRRNTENALGVSATHLDWTMVPYVRKSFYKHYKDALKYLIGMEERAIAEEMNFEPTDVPIDYTNVYSNEKCHQYALDMTVKETHQAVEGMYHNLK